MPSAESSRRVDRRRILDALLQASRDSSATAVFIHTAFAEQAGLNVTDMKALDLLDRLGPLTPGQIAAQTGLATASVTSLIDRLECKGLVRRVRDAADRRRVIVQPNQKRLQEASSFFQQWQEPFEKLLQRYTNEQLMTITDFLTRAAELSRETMTGQAMKEPRAQKGFAKR